MREKGGEKEEVRGGEKEEVRGGEGWWSLPDSFTPVAPGEDATRAAGELPDTRMDRFPLMLSLLLAVAESRRRLEMDTWMRAMRGGADGGWCVGG